MTKKSISVLLLLMCMTIIGHPQSNTGTITGRVTDVQNGALPHATVRLKGTPSGVAVNGEGYFEIRQVAAGQHTLEVSFVGYVTQQQSVTLSEGQTLELKFALEEDTRMLESIEVEGKTEIREVQEQAYAVSAIDTKKLLHISTDLNQVFNRVAGVRIREDGGLGSNFTFSLNGFSGNQVKFFLDGIPMDYFGSSLSLNNIPVNLAERVEIYKGVVPISLGGDALGGAVNVITRQDVKDFVDVSYSYGSFNTHRASALAHITTPKGWMINANAFYNYSDNNYWIDAQIPDPQTHKLEGYERVRRFHDVYRSHTVQVEAGVVDKKFADRLMVGLIASGNRKEVQTGMNMSQVAGQVYTKDEVLIPTLKYKKDNFFIDRLSISANAFYNFRDAQVVDTSSRVYDWRGDYTVRTTGTLAGELNWDKTLFTFKDRSVLASANASYVLNDRHSFSLNNTFSRFSRVGEDPISYTPVPFSSPNILKKNITGLSYRLDLFDKKWSTTFFAKAFVMDANVYEELGEDSLQHLQSDFFRMGVGIATAYYVKPWLQIKASFENTTRLPEGAEMFGDGLLLEPNPTLLPETSKNLNVGFLLTRGNERHRVNAEGNYLYRRPDDLIRLSAVAVTSVYVNLRSARISSVEGAVRYTYNKWLNVEANATYQSIINMDKYENGQVSNVYRDRLPNIPFLFANASVGVQFEEVGYRNSKLTADWSAMFVEAFYLKWPSQGNRQQKYDIPRQISHDLAVAYALEDGKYSVSLNCFNVMDSKRFDNFMLQKPGRSYAIRLHYFLSRAPKTRT